MNLNENKIIVEVKTKNSNQWMISAMDKINKECIENKIAFIDAEILVRLPERGRFFSKQRGETALRSYYYDPYYSFF